MNMIDAEGNPASLLVDKRSHRPRMLELNPPGAAGPVRVFFEDWRRVGDLLYFHSFLLTEGPERTFTYRYTSIAPNAVDASVLHGTPR
ncbi:MAG: hypothetical protein L0Z51_08650 [Candidatus Latescibacteria bacterium]|nr:hypothetical protein [Candidatus Latescibacterota bacterium]